LSEKGIGLREFVNGNGKVRKVLDFPDKISPRLKARFYLYNTTTLETHKMTNEEAIKKALAELELSLKPNYTEIA
jgi:hypothetical protein